MQQGRSSRANGQGDRAGKTGTASFNHTPATLSSQLRNRPHPQFFTGADFQSLTEAIDTATPAGRMMMQVIGSFAEFERTRTGLEAARQEGRVGGRRPKLSPQQQKEVIDLVQSGRKTGADAARLFRVHPSTVARLLVKAGQEGNQIFIPFSARQKSLKLFYINMLSLVAWMACGPSSKEFMSEHIGACAVNWPVPNFAYFRHGAGSQKTDNDLPSCATYRHGFKFFRGVSSWPVSSFMS